MPSRFTDSQTTDVIAGLHGFAPAVIYLFGSHGTPAEHPASDIDIAFLPTTPVDRVQCFQVSCDLAEKLGRDVDLVDLSQASTVMAKEVLRTGAPIAIKDPLHYRKFEMLTLSDYARLNEEREAVIAP